MRSESAPRLLVGRHFATASSALRRPLRYCLLASPPRGRYDRWLINDVTQLLSALEQGDLHAADRRPPLIYEVLRSLVG